MTGAEGRERSADPPAPWPEERGRGGGVGPREAEPESAMAWPESSYSRQARSWGSRSVLAGVLSAVLRDGWRSMAPGVPEGPGVGAGLSGSGSEGGDNLTGACRRVSRSRLPACRLVGPG